MEIAIAAVGDPLSPATWSGVPAGVIGGLKEIGVTVRAVDLSLPAPLETGLLVAAATPSRNRFDAESAPLTRTVRTALARRRVGAGTPLAGVIQIGTTYDLPARAPFVTLEDMTVLQGAAEHPVFSRMSARAVRGWEASRRAIYTRARSCTAASHWTADSLVRDYGVPPDRTAVVGFGANHRAGAPDRDWHVPRFLFVGIDWERKGGPEVLGAFARVRERRTDAELHLVGGHPPVSQPGVTGHGVLSQAREPDASLLADLFARATCFVMPSRVEPFGIAYVEAASAGVPSIATSVGGPRDVVGAEGGLLVAPGDAEGLVRAMLALAHPDAARRMGAAALVRSRLYTWTKVAERLLRALGVQAPDGRELADYL